MRLNGILYEYVATYVDDLCLRMLDPKSFTDTLQKKYNFKLKGTDNFRMNTRSGRYGAAYNMVGLRCFNEELSLLPKNPTEAKLQAMSTRGESTEPT
jgi:hypothetical protein